MSESVFDKIRSQREEEDKKKQEALHRENQDRVTKMLASRYADNEAVQDRLAEMQERYERQDQGNVFAKIRRKQEDWQDILVSWMDDPQSAANHLVLGMDLEQRRQARGKDGRSKTPTWV